VGFDISVLLWMVGIVGALMLIMRWVFAPSSRPHTGRPRSGPEADLGLLVPVVEHAPRSNALQVKDFLSTRGIRCSVSRLDRDSYDVLVFGRDVPRARELLDGEAAD
jgi:hypothetical protein